MCCPATNTGRSGMAKKKLLIRGVRGTTAITLVDCQRSRPAAPRPSDTTGASISGIALLLPGIAVDVIAAQLPEAGLVALGELESVEPLGGLPEVKVRNQQPGGPTMLARDGSALVCHRYHGAAADQVLRGDVGRVAVDGVREDVRGGRRDAGVRQQVVDRDAGPGGVEL